MREDEGKIPNTKYQNPNNIKIRKFNQIKAWMPTGHLFDREKSGFRFAPEWRKIGD